MDQYQTTKGSVLTLNTKTEGLLLQAEALCGNAASTFDRWKEACGTVHKIISGHVMRVAVVGAIKSGKSTMVNALLHDDYLKRGAGVVTSIVTRIRRGQSLKARLFFKSWDEINAEIERALVLFPSHDRHTEHEHFDIRQDNDRMHLSNALGALDAGMHLAEGGLNANSVLLSSYLRGYDDVKDMVDNDAATWDFDARRFGDHRSFVSQDRLAVYLKDIQLDITNETLHSNLEIADCQGSDSPNPLHMAMVQDYLFKAQLIVYVISSRTGLRQADLRFLSIIRKMGIADSILFVYNFDINEHAAIDDLEILINKTREELALILPDVQLHAFSALYHLFDVCQTQLSEKDQGSLTQWQACQNMVARSGRELACFCRVLEEKLTRDRSALLLQNQMEHIGRVLGGLRNWIGLNRDLLRRDAGEARDLADRIGNHQGMMLQVQSMIQGTLDGNMHTIKKDLKDKIDAFFEPHHGALLNNVIAFIRNFNVDLNRYGEDAVAAGFTQALYRVYQEFKQALNTHMAEKINPEIIRFVGQLENRLVDYFNSVVEPYGAMVSNTVGQFESEFAQFNLGQVAARHSFEMRSELEGIKQSMGLELLPAAATMHYSAHIKTDAVLHLGAYSLLRIVGKILNKPIGHKGSEESKALADGVRRMKRETERSVYANFKDYQENIKFQYMFLLVNAANARLYEYLSAHFGLHVADLNALVESMGSQCCDKERIDEALQTIEASTDLSRRRLDALRRDVALLRGDASEFGCRAADGTTGC